jgi:selenocysteine lyase/cysteine desulfurase
MFRKALEQITQWGVQPVQQYSETITLEPCKAIAGLGYAIAPPEQRAAHMFGIRIPDQQLMTRVRKACLAKKIRVSFRGDALRVSAHVYNRADELEALVAVLASVR